MMTATLLILFCFVSIDDTGIENRVQLYENGTGIMYVCDPIRPEKPIVVLWDQTGIFLNIYTENRRRPLEVLVGKGSRRFGARSRMQYTKTNCNDLTAKK